MDENEVGKCIVDVAIHIHQELGPGLLEVVYESILAYQLQQREYEVARQVSVPVVYQGLNFNEGFRVDLIIHRIVIIELKCVERLNYAHRKQLLTYLRLTGTHLGFLLNFSEPLMKNGIRRIVNGLAEKI